MKKKIALILAIILTVCLAFSGCGGGSAGDLEKFELVLDWYPNAIHTFIYSAIENGYYEDEGIELVLRFPSSTSDAISLAAVGKVDAGIYYVNQVIEANVEQNIPIRSFGSVVQSPLTVFISLAENKINTPADMVGKTLGGGGSEITDKVIHHIMKDQGFKPDDVNIVDIGFEQISALATKSVDVTYGGMINHEVPQLEKEGFDVSYFYPTEYGIPDCYEMIFIAGEDALNTNTEKYEKFLRASMKGFEFVKANPEKALDIIFEHQNAENFPLDREVETKSLDILLPVMETETKKFLDQDEAVWQENIDWLYDNGIISGTIDASEIVFDMNDIIEDK